MSNGDRQDKALFWLMVGVGFIFLLSLIGKLFS
jgi:hypothetical protein